MAYWPIGWIVLTRLGKAPANGFRLPELSHRVLINGRTGSGKTIGGLWLLSQSAFHKQPFVIVDYKRDKTIARIEGKRSISLKDKLPVHPGIYHLEPTPADDDAMERWLWSVWKRGRIGLFFDEGYLVPPTDVLKTIYTTGRSLDIPTITLSQRPVGLPPWAVSEADFHWLYHVRKFADRERIASETPFVANARGLSQVASEWDEELVNLDRRLPPYWSRWFDVDRDVIVKLSPVPPAEVILSTFKRRLTPRRRLI